MNGDTVGKGRLGSAVLVFYLLYVFGSTFSRAWAELSLGVALALFLVVLITTRHNPFSQPLRWFYLLSGLYVGWLLLSALVSRAPMASVYFTRKEWLFAAVPIGVYLMQQGRNRERLVWGLAIGVALVSLYAVSQYITGWDWLNFREGWFKPVQVDTVCGNFRRANTFAGFFSVAAMFLLAYAVFPEGKWDRRRVGLVVIAVIAMAAVLLSFRRGPVIYLIIGLVFLAIVKKHTMRWSAFGLALMLTLSMLTVPSLRERFALPIPTEDAADYLGSRPFIWKQSLALVVENPVFGVGNGNFGDAYGEIVQRDLGVDLPWWWRHGQAHNDLLNTAAIGGIPCALIFTALWILIIRRLIQAFDAAGWSESDRRALFAALLGSALFVLTSLTVSSFADHETHALIMFIWAFGLAPWYNWKIDRAARSVDLNA